MEGTTVAERSRKAEPAYQPKIAHSKLLIGR